MLSSASALWADTHEDLIEERKRALSGGHGTHQKAVTELFYKCSSEKQALWQDSVEAAKIALLNDSNICFNFGPKQIGLALIDFCMAICCKDGSILHDQYIQLHCIT
ncbi:hypothetical protein LXA43DRAFT_1066482 [Ganoderma leucocontextum]|nr:hypothetical protein LXA43DRAFT_1066482 [Ganoderma leucocontextum]